MGFHVRDVKCRCGHTLRIPIRGPIEPDYERISEVRGEFLKVQNDYKESEKEVDRLLVLIGELRMEVAQARQARRRNR